jgi:release factor glutamine methyltransferase
VRARAASARQAAREAVERLECAGVPEPVASAEVLLSELLGIGRDEIALHREPLRGEQAARYEAWISRRIKREPVQRILGYAYFRNLKLELNEETLIPRPDTESVVEAALELIDRRGGRCRVLDIGTGSGAIATSIAQERPSCEVHATDISGVALDAARRNAERAGVQVHFYRADVVSGLDELRGSIGLLVSNPPYVRSDDTQRLAPEVREWDPPGALYSGPDDLVFYRRIFAETPPLLEDGSGVVLEVGEDQAGVVLDLGREAGFVPLGIRPDLAGTPRAVLLRWEKR